MTSNTAAFLTRNNVRLFVLRHGDAEARAATDRERHLTQHGHNEVAAVVEQSLSELQPVEKIIASPYIRAQQTASIVAKALQLPIETNTEITPDGNLAAVIELIEKSGADNLLLVSHQPLVGSLVNGLLGKPSGYYAMGTAALAVIDLDPVALGCGELCWLK